MMATSPGCSRLVRFFVRRSSRTGPLISAGAPRLRMRVGSRMSGPILALLARRVVRPSKREARLSMALGQTIPALPVRDVGRAVGCYIDRLGLPCLTVTRFAIVRRDE